ncbi:MAG TPA: cytochrome c [Chitinophagaceae bacterium]|nr:cytochrome c [Chitinophagaceae bacterium]
MKKKSPHFYFISSVLVVSSFFSGHVYAQKTPWIAPKDVAAVSNPLAGNTAVLGEAKKLYLSTCAPCHGQGGKGNGVAASALNPKPADHTSDAVQAQTDGALFWMISQGRNAMPQYKAVLTEKQRWELINYIRTLAKNKK